MKITIELQPIYCEYEDFSWLAKYVEGHGECLTNGMLQASVVGYGTSELEAVSDLMEATRVALGEGIRIK
jgi:hypothetical protein